ncbi:MAG: aldo/keto reductase [Nostoc sp.]|uniref:aldo/keto reductase n=1 Tax=Nostoc sp. TaxID=1180 RepID=UPI002FF26DED
MRRYHKLFHRNYDIGTVSDLEKGYDIVEVLHEMANNRGVSVAQVALNWLLRQSGITSVIIGARNEQQLRDNLGAAQWELTLEEVNRLNQVNQVSAIAPIYPYWHQRTFGAERTPQ